MRSPLAWRVAGCAAMIAVVSSWSGAAEAFCQSTTCIEDCEIDASSCKAEGTPLFWATSCVGFSLQKDASDYLPMEMARPAIEASFASWAALQCADGEASITFVALDDVTCRKAEFNEDEGNANIVLFQDFKWRYTSTDNTLAKTTVTYDDETGQILDADIEINHAYNEYTVGDDYVVNDLQSVVTHEVGHLIGMDHTLAIGATMAADYAEGSVEHRTLAQDDIDAACASYPPGRSATCDSTPLGGFSKVCGGEEVAVEAREDEGGCSVVSPGTGSTPPFDWVWLTPLAFLLMPRRARRLRRAGLA